MRKMTLPALLVVLALAAVLLPAVAATPSTVVVGTHASKASWVGGPYTNVNVGPLEGVECPSAAQDPADAVCDHVALTVDVPSGWWKTHEGGVRISLTGTDGGLQMFVYNPAGTIVGEADADSVHEPSVYLWHASGSYEVRVNPEAAILTSYTGTVSFQSVKGVARAFAAAPSASFHGLLVKEQPSKQPQNAAVRAASGQSLAFRTTYVGRRAAEPTIGIDRKGGVLFPAGAFDALPKESPKNLARTVVLASTDGGKTFHSVQPPLVPGTTTDGEPVTLDPYVYVDQDTGRWFDVDLKGGYTSIQYSDDQGATWTRSAAMNPGVNDHQTLTAGVIPAGSPLVTTDATFPKIVYYCTNQVYGSICARSLDGGRTFTPVGEAYSPVDPSASFPVCLSLHGHLITDHSGRMFIPRGYCNRPFVSISSDAGTTWHQVKVSDAVGIPHIQSAVAVDAADNLFYTWWDDVYRLPYLSISRDHGEHWSTPRMIAPPGVRNTVFPTITAGDAGRIAVSFPGTTATDPTDMTRPWNQYIVVSIDALSKNPSFSSAIVNPGGPSDPIHRGHCANNRCANLYDFLDIETAPDATGTIWATAVDTCTKLNKCSTVRAAGATGIIQGPQDGVSGDGQGVAIKQISGPRLRVKPLGAPTYKPRAGSAQSSVNQAQAPSAAGAPKPAPARPAATKRSSPVDPSIPVAAAIGALAVALQRRRIFRGARARTLR